MKGGGQKMGNCGYGACYAMSSGSPGRNFLTREEKIEMLQDYKNDLESEAKGVAERIKELESKED